MSGHDHPLCVFLSQHCSPRASCPTLDAWWQFPSPQSRWPDQVPCAPSSCPFLGPCPPCCWSQICSAAVAKSKQQLTAIDGWGLPLHLVTDKCFNLSTLRNHIDWRDFVLFLGSVSQKGNSSFNIFPPRARFYCTLSRKSFIFKAQGKWSL